MSDQVDPALPRPGARWRPTRFRPRSDGSWRAARDPADVRPGSTFVTDRLAREYPALVTRHARGRLLDLGCGRAPLAGVYAGLVDVAVTLDRRPAPEVAVVADLDAPLPVGDAAVDTLLATDVLEHVRRPAALWAEAARVLAPGGTLLVGVPFLVGLHEEPHDHHRFTEHALRAAAADVDLEVLELRPYGDVVDLLADLGVRALGELGRGRGAHVAAGVLSPLHRRRRRVRRLPLGYVAAFRRPAS